MNEKQHRIVSDTSMSAESRRRGSRGKMARRIGMTYFDSLPSDALEQIIRGMSRKPSARDWPRWIASEDIVALYSVGGSMTRLCLARFRMFAVGNLYPALSIANADDDPKRTLYVRWWDFTEILPVIGPSILRHRSAFSVRTGGAKWDTWTLSLLDSIQKYREYRKLLRRR